jgi:hypothetical protein
MSCWLASFAGACSGSGDDPVEPQLRDTTGAEFEFPDEGQKVIQSIEALTVECNGNQLVEFQIVRGNTGLAMICVIDPRSQFPADYSCRPVACSQATECPTSFECEQGQCRAPGGGEKLHSLELMARCLGTTPRFARCLDYYKDPSWGKVTQVVLTECDGDGLCTVPSDCVHGLPR